MKQDFLRWWIPATLMLLAVAQYTALVWAPPEQHMGDVYRILYVHVPAAWLCLLAFTCAFVYAVLYLLTGELGWDWLAASSAEVGWVFNGLLLVTGAIWGKPTWGVFWTWDPRLTTALILWFAYGSYLLLRTFLPDPAQRAMYASVLMILIFADVPIVYYSVKWWSSLHQVQSSPQTVAAPMVLALRLNAFAFLGLYVWFCSWGYRVMAQRHARLQQALEGEYFAN